MANAVMVAPATGLGLLTFDCQPVGGPVWPSGKLESSTGASLVPQTGDEPKSVRKRPSPLLKPPSATGLSAGQKLVTVPADVRLTLIDDLTRVNVLSLVTAVARQITFDSRLC